MTGRTPTSGYVPVDAVFAGSAAGAVYLSAGERLREARVKLGLTLDSAAARTRIKRDYLEALETMDPRGLPSRAYAIGYLRTYARFLGLKDDAIVEQFKREADCATGRAQPTAPKEKKEIRVPRGVFGAVMILSGVLAAGWWYVSHVESDGAFADVPPPPDAVSQRAEQQLFAALPDASVETIWNGLPATLTRDIVLRAHAPVWLEVRDGSGRVLFSRELAGGEAYRAVAEAGLTVSAADAGQVEVMVNGHSAGRLGEAGRSAENLPLVFDRHQAAAGRG
ncbi:MAG: helix-turn-helix domain-containing protein [Maricaulaceae bacterium]|nr:helix-turn-helix domain-containing protein [Maricaulaceae bacterium]